MFGIFKNKFVQNENIEVKNAVNTGIFLVDVRTPVEFASGSVKGAVNIPLDTLHNHLYKFKDKKNILVFCRSGNRSEQAKRVLDSNGFQNVINGGTWERVNRILNE